VADLHTIPLDRASRSIGVVIRQANSADAPRVAAVLTAAAQWLEQNGKWNDWPVPYPVTALELPIGQGSVYIVEDTRKTAIATATLQWSDERYWGPQPADAGYLHRLAVTPAMMGQRVGAAIIDWAAHRVRAAGRRLLRLDCPEQSRGLRRYYEAEGFQYVGAYASSSGYKAALYERPED
jgi:GNAT superfamily N-acetyltransferase